MANIFTKHPQSVNETYLTHFKFAATFGSKMIIAGFACVIHSIFPFCFERTGTNMVNYLAKVCRERCELMDKAKNG